MILVDSCGWLEYFTDGPLADKYYHYLKVPHNVIVPTIVEYEVYKKIKREASEEQAVQASALMHASLIVPLSDSLALQTADLSLQFALPMADAIVYATARSENVRLVTSDEHFRKLENVVYLS